ncbi:hypothetical protein HRbin22_01004 [Candidatus Thermoflexus japonica]|uniref:Uncharacterized protein n=1 Tax=Candidatus Thermoflexus japonica TaxID=2035417 RepID=A0A2H5Y5P1_9CHLR|nr:hypothetical protein HRbin22_01004 [Candidatus Thermoflexus japonica]
MDRLSDPRFYNILLVLALCVALGVLHIGPKGLILIILICAWLGWIRLFP